MFLESDCILLVCDESLHLFVFVASSFIKLTTLFVCLFTKVSFFADVCLKYVIFLGSLLK